MEVTEFGDSWYVHDTFDNGYAQFVYHVLIPKDSNTGEIMVDDMSKSQIENNLGLVRRQIEDAIRKHSLGLEADFGLTVDEVADSITQNDSSRLSKEQSDFVTSLLNSGDIGGLFQDYEHQDNLLGLFDSFDNFTPEDLNSFVDKKDPDNVMDSDPLQEEDVYPWRKCIRDGKAKGLRPSQARKRCGYIKYHNRGKHEDCECDTMPHAFEEDCPICIEELIAGMKSEDVYPCDECSTVLFSEDALRKHKNFAHTTYDMGLSGGELIETTDKNYEEQGDEDEPDCESCGGAGDENCSCRGQDENCSRCQGTGYVDCSDCEGWGTKSEEIGRFGRNKKPITIPQQSKVPTSSDYPDKYRLDVAPPDEFRKPTSQELSDYTTKSPYYQYYKCPKCGEEFDRPQDGYRHLKYVHGLYEEKKSPPIPEQDETSGVPYAPPFEQYPDKKYRPKRLEWTCELCNYPARSRKWYRQHMKEAHQIEKKELDELSPENEYGPEIDVNKPDYDRQHTPKDKKHRKEESSISLDVNDNLDNCITCGGEGKLTLEELEEVSKVACPDCQGTGLDYMQNVDDAFGGES